MIDIHENLDPMTYYLVLMPTYVFAEKIAAIETVVPKSAKDSMVFPFHETTFPRVQTRYGKKKTTADWYKPSAMYSQNFAFVYSRPRMPRMYN